MGGFEAEMPKARHLGPSVKYVKDVTCKVSFSVYKVKYYFY